MSEETLAWRAIRTGCAVLDRDGNNVGVVTRVLGDDNADIFHGVAVRRGSTRGEAEITANRIELITESALQTSLSSEEADQLPPPPGG